MWVIVARNNDSWSLATDRQFSNYHAALEHANATLPPCPPPPAEPAWVVLPLQRAGDLIERRLLSPSAGPPFPPARLRLHSPKE